MGPGREGYTRKVSNRGRKEEWGREWGRSRGLLGSFSGYLAGAGSINTLRRVNSVWRARGRATTGINEVHDARLHRAVDLVGIISSQAIPSRRQFVSGRWIKRRRRRVICNLDNGMPLPEPRKTSVRGYECDC